MKKILLLLGISICFISCDSDTSNASTTEKNAVEALEEAYDTDVTFSKGTLDENGTPFEIFSAKMETNSLLDTLNMVYAGSHMGMLVYEQLSKEERDFYGGFQIQLERNGEAYSQAFKFNKEITPLAIERSKKFNEFSEKILQKRYEEATNLIAPKNRNEGGAAALEAYIEADIIEHGNPTGYKRTGWGMNATNTVYHFDGYFEFENGYVLPYLLAMSNDTEDDYVIGYQFE